MDFGVMVEVCNLVELYEVFQVGQVICILLDNFEQLLMEEVVYMVNKCFEMEVFGGVNIYNVCEVVLMGVDYVFVGVLMYLVQSLDLSLKVVKEVVVQDQRFLKISRVFLNVSLSIGKIFLGRVFNLYCFFED